MPASAKVLDNFDAASRSGWQDFTFVTGLGLPTQTGGRYVFDLPPAGQSLFVASTKTSEEFTLQEGRTIEMRVDLINGNGPDAYAVLAWIPGDAGNAQTLQGYGLSKSQSDILVTKGINEYFVDDSPADPIKNTNVTLVLSLTAQSGNVIIEGKVLDKDNNNAVLWDKTFVDTPAADPLGTGKDTPAAPYLGSGHYTLYCYENFHAGAPQDVYEVIYDNAAVYVTDKVVVDNFDAATRSGWQDFTFVPGFGLPKQANGQYTFDLPPAGQALFVASTKVSETFDLTEGNRLSLSVDLVNGNSDYSYAVLAWVPGSADNAQTLSGYGLSKSQSDTLVSKGINQYFIDDSPTIPIKNTNVTLTLTLTMDSGIVTIEGKVLDKDNNNAVLWDKTFQDTPAADPLATGTDAPPAPYSGTGHFTLFCYENFNAAGPSDVYEVIYDNAIIWAPPVASNTPPVITGIGPANTSNFLPTSTQISFTVTDDKNLGNTNVSVLLNGETFTTSNGLQVAGAGTKSLTVTLGGLSANVNYAATLQAVDSDGTSITSPLYFDTFQTTDLVIESEDYNFNSGQFIDNPLPLPEGTGPEADGYANQTGTQGIDYTDTRTDFADSLYRSQDNDRMQHSLDVQRQKFIAAGGTAAGVYDYDVVDIVAGEWLNYTRTFTAGSYKVFLRQAVANMAQSTVTLNQITSDISQTNQTGKPLGTFLGVTTGFQYRNVPLTDGTGANSIILRLSGVTTLQVLQGTTDSSNGGAAENYLIFVPVPDPGIQRATVSALSPANGTAVQTVAPVVTASIQNRDTSVKPGTIVLSINGTPVAPTVTNTADGVSLGYPISPLPASGTTNFARIVFQDNLNVLITNDWTFVVSYNALDPANRVAGTGDERGMNVRVVQAPIEAGPLDNTLLRAEAQLAPNSTIPIYMETNVVLQTINMSEDDQPRGFFPDKIIVPGIDPNYSTDDYAVEILTYLDLSAGAHRFGVVTDDGYKVASGASLKDPNAPLLGFHNGGPANETFDFVVTQAGLYPFRMVWYERGGSSYAEWWSTDLATSTNRVLINDPDSANAVKGYTSFKASVAPTISISVTGGNTVMTFTGTLQAADDVTGPYQDVTGATSPRTVNTAGASKKFWRARR